jgi:hypothetical protein
MLLEHSRPFPGTKPSMSRGQTDEHQGEARPFCTFRDPVSRAYHHWLAARQLDRADEHARGLLANAERYGVQKYLAVAHRILGEIAKISGDLNVAEEQLLRSTEPLGKTRLRWLNGDATPRLVRPQNAKTSHPLKMYNSCGRCIQISNLRIRFG